MTRVKVVIFCGGLGVRMGEATQRIPKPMITVGSRPILWHIMKWYASWGHDDFILCLGYKGECIKEYFLDYNEALSNDFVLSNGGRDVELLGSDISDWRDHVRRHRAQVDDRRAAAGGRAAPRRRRVLPRDLRRRPHRRAARRHDRAARARRGRPGSSCRCARCSTPTSSTPTPTASSRRSRTCSRRTSGSTAASSSSGATSSTTSTRARSSSSSRSAG